jgi:hypothetical protein
VSEWPQYYILIDRLPVAVNFNIWAQWFANIDNQRVGEDYIGKVHVSTVFLGLDHNWHGGDPILFETMIFHGPLDRETWRYCTYAEAERGHAEAMTQAKIAAAKIKSIADNAGITSL